MSSGNEDRVYEGIVQRVVVRRSGRFVYLVFFFFILLLGGIYHLSTEEEGYGLLYSPSTPLSPSVRQRVGEVIDQVMSLRAKSKYDEAYALLKEMHEKYPEQAALNRELAWHNVEKGLYVFASEYFDLAAERMPANSKLNFYRGELHRRWAKRYTEDASHPNKKGKQRYHLLSTALEHLELSRSYFQKSLDGDYIFNFDGVKVKLEEVDEARFSIRYDLARLLYNRAKGALATDQSLLEQALAHLERLAKEDDLGSGMRMRVQDLIKEITKER